MIFNFTVSGTEEQIVQFERELLEILTRITGDQDMVAHEIHFCIHEAILNILQHSYCWKKDLPIDVKLIVSGSDESKDKVLEIQIKDTGPAIQKPLEPPEKIDRFQMRKRGIYMISKIMDEFTVRYDGKSGNITYMKKSLSRLDDQILNISV